MYAGDRAVVPPPGGPSWGNADVTASRTVPTVRTELNILKPERYCPKRIEKVSILQQVPNECDEKILEQGNTKEIL